MTAASMDVSGFRRDLAGWFRQHARKLTWRKTQDPYAIWVSEVMLQQTRVETVERYFSPFIARFPTFEALAAASQDEVLAAWSGLGYYRRARLLHRGAQYLVEKGVKQLPQSAAQLREIPGIGPYTAGAIASIAFNRREPLVDGNVARVSSRLRCVKDPKAQGALAKDHWSFVAHILEDGRPRELAQALMELGAMRCTPRQPACEECPVRSHCQAHAQGLMHQIPAPKTKAKVLTQHWQALALQDKRGAVLVHKRASGQLLEGMWCLPLLPQDPKGPASGRQWRSQWPKLSGQSWPAALGKTWKNPTPVDAEPVQHIFTHRRWHLALVRLQLNVEFRELLEADPNFALLDEMQAPVGGVPKLTKKLVAALLT